MSVKPPLEDARRGARVALAPLAFALGGCRTSAAALLAARRLAELLPNRCIVERAMALALSAAFGPKLGGELFAEAAELSGLIVFCAVGAKRDADHDRRHILAVQQAANRSGGIVLRFGEVDRAQRKGESVVPGRTGYADPALAGINAEDAAPLHGA